MQTLRNGLLRQQAELQAQIDQVTQALEALGGSVVGGHSRPARPTGNSARSGVRGRRQDSLKSRILKVMKVGEEMAVKDIAAAVRKAGYKTNSVNFGNQVSNALAQMKEVSKTGRGRFKR